MTFLPNFIDLIVSIFTTIKLAATNFTFIKLAPAIISSSAITINPDSIFSALYRRLSTLWNLQHQVKWYSYSTKSLDKLLIKVGKSEKDLNISYRPELRRLHDCLNSFLCYADAFWRYHIVGEPSFFLMKLTLLKVSIYQELPELYQNLLYNYNMAISIIISINENAVQIYNDENIKFFSKDLVDISLEAF